MLLLFIAYIFNLFVLLFFLPTIIGSQNGNTKIEILINVSVEYSYKDFIDSPFKTYLLPDMINNYYIIFWIKKASINKIFFCFISGAILLLCNFILLFLQFNYFIRAMIDYIIPLRNYAAKLFSIEESGQKINLDLINVIPSTITKKININGKEIDENIQIYTRRILNEIVPIQMNN